MQQNPVGVPGALAPPHLGKDLLFSAPPQTVWYSYLFDLFHTTLCSWNTHSDGSAIPEHGKWYSKNTWARCSSGIESKYKFGYKYGLRSNLRETLRLNMCVRVCAHVHVCVYACLCIMCVCTRAHLHTRVCMYTCACIRVCVCMCVYSGSGTGGGGGGGLGGSSPPYCKV